MEKPLTIDLYCGLGGWAEGFLSEGYEVIGFDIERHDYGTGGYPGQLVLQDIRGLHGRQFRRATVIVGSSPCQKYSYMAMPWKRAKVLAAWYAASPERLAELNELFDAQFRIQREASEAAGRYIPMVVENVRGAQKWVGRAKWHFGSYYLWGDVPALMPITLKELKQPGRNFHFPEKYGIPSPSFHGHAAEPSVVAALALKTVGHINKRDGHTHTRHLTNQAEHDSVKLGGSWFHGYRIGQGPRNHGSNSVKRKAASAQIAKIPFRLAQHIAKCFKPEANAQIAGLGRTGVSQKAK